MTTLEPVETMESSFEIEEGTLDSHLPRPNSALLTCGGGLLMVIAGFFCRGLPFDKMFRIILQLRR